MECPSKASFPFTTSTSLSAPHVAFETIAVRQGGLLPDFLEPPGGTSRPPKRTHSDLEFFFLLMKIRLCGRWGWRTLWNKGKARATEVCGASTVFGILITIKFGKRTVSVLTFGGIVAFDSLWPLWPAPEDLALCPRFKGHLSFSAHLTPLVHMNFVFLRENRYSPSALCY